MPRTLVPLSGRYLSFAEREEVAILRAQQYGSREIARGLAPQLAGRAFAADYAVPIPATLTSAVGEMQTAYLDAANRITPDFLELATGNIGGLTLAPGLYKSTTGISIPTDVTIAGGPNDVSLTQPAP